MDWLPSEDLCAVTSGQSDDYNCLGWVVEQRIELAEAWWPPGRSPLTTAGTKWMAHLPTDPTDPDTFAAFLAEFGFTRASTEEDGRLEDRIEKVVMYAKDGIPSHFARQRTDGTWCSKLGGLADVTHRGPGDAQCREYGEPMSFFLRARIS